MSWEPVIGLEIHVQLKTETKMFCRCRVGFGAGENTQTCPVCLGFPGALPVMNRRAVEWTIKLGLALDCEIAEHAVFARKNYFYPDLPKGYQISQYDLPSCINGKVILPSAEGDRVIGIVRAHLEEDAAKTVHVGGRTGRIGGADYSLVDFNRGGTPLVEIVTEPDLREPGQAREWLQLLRSTIKAIGASDVNMEEGSLRCDANISLRPAGSDELGTKTELKNMNSFRFIERGIAAEIERQREILDSGGAVSQDTLHFDPRDGSLTSLRSKEYAHDYRYFPEPDLVPLAPTDEMLASARESLPELPAERRERYLTQLELGRKEADQLAFTKELGDYLDAGLLALEGQDGGPKVTPQRFVGLVLGELAGLLSAEDIGVEELDTIKLTPPKLAEIGNLQAAGGISSSSARKLMRLVLAEGGDPAEIVEREGLGQMEDSGELEAIVEAALEAEPDAAQKVRDGNMKAVGPLVGFVMKETKGRADGGEVTRLIREKLGA